MGLSLVTFDEKQPFEQIEVRPLDPRGNGNLLPKAQVVAGSSIYAFVDNLCEE